MSLSPLGLGHACKRPVGPRGAQLGLPLHTAKFGASSLDRREEELCIFGSFVATPADHREIAAIRNGERAARLEPEVEAGQCVNGSECNQEARAEGTASSEEFAVGGLIAAKSLQGECREIEVPVEELEEVGVVVLEDVAAKELLPDELLEAVLSDEDVETEELELLLVELLDVAAALLVELGGSVEELEVALAVLESEELEDPDEVPVDEVSVEEKPAEDVSVEALLVYDVLVDDGLVEEVLIPVDEEPKEEDARELVVDETTEADSDDVAEEPIPDELELDEVDVADCGWLMLDDVLPLELPVKELEVVERVVEIATLALLKVVFIHWDKLDGEVMGLLAKGELTPVLVNTDVGAGVLDDAMEATLLDDIPLTIPKINSKSAEASGGPWAAIVPTTANRRAVSFNMPIFSVTDAKRNARS
ncbi:hypothetical protein CPLU01_11704 [Colletotrichum plurivorum]|uniref:Uncharacterized protein n=1 Tax=Colletotrichum plurivorum TaxID=2175906 RepID=A0A8H6K1Y1_9PEZI|nr:hypothetical protein CPLU01_11704 [Colletotrichum plurivorum]